MMKPVYQTIFTPPHGNCFQASVASLLELELDDVPNFMLAEGDLWIKEFRKFLEDCGLFAVDVSPFAPESETLSRIDCEHLIAAKSPRGDYLHSMVGKNGVPIHDPFPGGNCDHNGLVSYCFIFPSMYYWIHFGEE